MDDTVKVEVKLAVLLPGMIADLAFNYMVNQGAGKTEQIMKVFNSTVIESLNNYDDVYSNIETLVDNGYNYIMTSDLSQQEAAFDAANRWSVKKQVYFLIRSDGSYSSKSTLVSTYDINPVSPFYMLGYIAGLQSAQMTNKIGLVVPGPDTENYYTANAFYAGANKANPNAKLYTVSTSSYDDADTAGGAIDRLSKLKIDIVSQSQTSNQVCEAFVHNGTFGLGSNGFPYESILGGSVIQSIVMNFETIFSYVGVTIQYQNYTQNDYYLDFNSGFYTLDRYSFIVDDNFKSMSNAVYNDLRSKNAADHPYLCNPLNKPMFGDNCIKFGQMLGMEQLYSQIDDQGYFAMPTTEIYDRKQINSAFVSVSAIQIGVAFIFFVLCIVFKKRLPIQYSNILFCFGLGFGAILVPIGVILFNTHQKTTGICTSRIWMLSLGYNFLIGLMIIKNTRIYFKFKQLLETRSDEISPIPPAQVYSWYTGLLLVNILLLALYTGVGNPSNHDSLGLDGIGKYEYTQNCVNNKAGDNIIYALLVFHGLQLLYGCLISWKTRTIDLEEFEETHEFASAIYLISFTLFIVIPLMAGIENQRSRDAIISSMAVFTTFTTLLIIFGSKMWKIYKPVEDDGLPQIKMQQLPDKRRGKTSPYNHSTLTKSAFLTAVVNPTGSSSFKDPADN
ncbi:G-protein-coupled receptor family 3 protein 11 [Heterostelium album PN500]|uniref:G-protein-coupled receptor family 3 protein 11 n=1 Tax=Heterostelium pallidum (strain ATCC 26659 / Pp 5 / PN500) TaxID=670386 RepID=D3AYY3_HETP5|nr:G-protein-coupled receptor family 3 protein 11 [Heterostelium album PN500]EFA85673.1 G-protein-coupled receptor family 3 protein 11 [Heterostelium album PN500]|eukprot:XP_020437780.1 G-protein-coupled receptor family 3 protein 11 [Heterostelium album PN500]